MRQSGEGGSIINLSSIQALRPAAELAAYSASKAAVRALTKSVALHAARDRIRCNSVHPGGELGRASCRERRVSLRVDIGGHGILKKNKYYNKSTQHIKTRLEQPRH